MKHSLVLLAIAMALGAASPARADSIGGPGSSNGPPAGITPVTVKLQTVLDNYDAALGSATHRSVTDIEQGTITAYGLAGTYRDVYAGLHYGDDFRSSTSLGPFSSSNGRLNGQRWHHDENAITNVVQDAVRDDEADARTFSGETRNPKNDVTLLGEVTTPVDAYVVQVARKNLSPFWEFYDKKTGLLDRVEIGDPADRETVTFDDYRLANGMREAWHTHHSDKYPENDYDSRITSDRYGVTLAPDDLAIPPSRQGFVTFPAGKPEVDIPSDVTVESLAPLGLSGTFSDPFVRVTIGGRGLDMLLDSTATDMQLDDEVAKELGLTRYGPYDVDEKGHTYPTRAVAPAMSIGDLQMQNVTVHLDHFNDYGEGRRVVGRVGYDFLANAVVEIDYTHNALKAYDPVQFLPPADSVPTPVDVDDGIPFVPAQVGTSSGNYFMVDDTSPFTIIFPDFWEAHPDAVQDQGAGKQVNWRFFWSKDSDMKATQLKALNFGGVRFDEWVAYEAMDTEDLEGVNVDGVIGCDFLQYFNVFFDYAQQQIYLEPNALYKRSVKY